MAGAGLLQIRGYMMGFIFGGDTKMTYAQLQNQRALAAQMARGRRAPRNVGEGLSAIGNALLYRSIMNKTNKRQGELRGTLDKKWGALFPTQQQPQGVQPDQTTGMGSASFDSQDPRNEASQNSQRQNPVLQGDIARFADGIASVESKGSGGYSALGPVTKNGHQAYGRYQVMDFNIPDWTKKYVGREMTPQEFLASPPAQDAVFKGEFGGKVQKYGTPQDAASVWFSGQPQAGNNASDGYNTVPQYLQKFNSALGQSSSQQPSVQQIISVIGDPMANPAQRQYAGTLLQQRMAADQPMSEMDRIRLQTARVKLDQLQNPQASDRRIVTGMDGRQYYADNQSPVLPDINPPSPTEMSQLALEKSRLGNEKLRRDMAGGGNNIFNGKSVQAQALNQLVTGGNLTKEQALQIAAGKTVTGKDGEIIFMTPAGIFANDPRNGVTKPVDAPQMNPPQPGQQPDPMGYGPQMNPPQTPAPQMMDNPQPQTKYPAGSFPLTPAKRMKLSDAESKSVGFYQRSTNSNEILGKLETQGLSFKGKALNEIPFGAGNFAQTSDYQRYDQARRDFVNAILRRESGAVINPEEFKNADIQYFPQPGDGPDVIAQKRKNREIAVRGLLVSTGRYGQELGQQNQQTAPSTGDDPLGLFSQ